MMMLGRLTATKKEGTTSQANLVARIIMEEVEGRMKFSLYQAQSWEASK